MLFIWRHGGVSERVVPQNAVFSGLSVHLDASSPCGADVGSHPGCEARAFRVMPISFQQMWTYTLGPRSRLKQQQGCSAVRGTFLCLKLSTWMLMASAEPLEGGESDDSDSLAARTSERRNGLGRVFAPHLMISLRGEGTMKVSKVTGHATQTMVDKGDARHEDLVGNDGADKAAD